MRGSLLWSKSDENSEASVSKAYSARGYGWHRLRSTRQEKLSLVARFGVTIYFGSPDKKEFQEIVRVLAKKGGIDMPEEELLLEANKWELSHGGLSGRTAQQFVDYLMGKTGFAGEPSFE